MSTSLTLTPEQSALYDLGFWDAFNIELTCIEWADEHAPQEPVVVYSHEGTVLFALTAGRRA